MLQVPQERIQSETALIQPALDRNRETWRLQKTHFLAHRNPFEADFKLPDFLIGLFDFLPLKLKDDGFDPDLLRKLEIGYDRRNERITYPLRDMYGNLAGFSGGAMWPDQKPKYKVYQGRRKAANRKWIPGDFGEEFDAQYPDYRCENHDFLWNFHRVFPTLNTSEADDTVYVVEGFKACLWMLQAGFENVVALMGSYISDRQQRMLHMVGGRVVLFLDNDDAGRKATFNVGDLLWRPLAGRIHVMPYPEEDVVASLERKENTQPDDYELDSLKTLANNAMTFTQYFNHMRSTGRW